MTSMGQAFSVGGLRSWVQYKLLSEPADGWTGQQRATQGSAKAPGPDPFRRPGGDPNARALTRPGPRATVEHGAGRNKMATAALSAPAPVRVVAECDPGYRTAVTVLGDDWLERLEETRLVIEKTRPSNNPNA